MSVVSVVSVVLHPLATSVLSTYSIPCIDLEGAGRWGNEMDGSCRITDMTDVTDGHVPALNANHHNYKEIP